eukprot:CAMPEP_0118649388 /NCGR_PEP_ID=MMETSP0785-20121206/9676_1 /TAXON_ID=91992 /ORGANISM="Bolidomonas pacifica, Strain CCMP 1866" /LENGTH=526 /DNA_ID=CAMNT_0006541671 /DNA_START=155 /DNA_END=1735 /DNA_ORIENTATION=+
MSREDFVASFGQNFSTYMMESAAIAFIISVSGSALLFPIYLNSESLASSYYEDNAANKLAYNRTTNISVVPMSLAKYESYNLESPEVHISFWIMRAVVMFALVAPSFFLSIGLGKLSSENKRGLITHTFLFICFYALVCAIDMMEYRAISQGDDESIYILINMILYLLYSFFVYFIAMSFSLDKKRKRRRWKISWALFKFDFLFLFTTTIFAFEFLPRFFDEGTSYIVKAVIRGVIVCTSLSAFIEAGSRTSVFLVTTCNISSNSAELLLVRPLMMMSLAGRIMQGSASTFKESIFYEVCGTLSELVTADQMLRGVTPIMAWDMSYLWKEKNKINKVDVGDAVKSDDNDGGDTEKSSRTDKEETTRSTEKERLDFCSMALVVLTLSETSSILITSVYWLVQKVNPSEVGAEGGQIPNSVVLMNLLVMIIGEWVVSESIVVYVSHHFAKRYSNNVSLRWAQFRHANHHTTTISTLVFIASLMPVFVLNSIDYELCITSNVEVNAQDWTQGRCPRVPENSTEMSVFLG